MGSFLNVLQTTALTMLNGWVNNSAVVRKDVNGIVRITGRVTSGTSADGTAIAGQLPSGFLPAADQYFVCRCDAGTGVCQVYVNTAGYIVVLSGASGAGSIWLNTLEYLGT